jgi:hypothetical protein
LIDWLSEVSDKMNFKSATLHSSISILDQLLEKQQQLPYSNYLMGLDSEAQLKYFALMCLSISAKNFEIDPMPTSRDILRHHPGHPVIPNNKVSTGEVERTILKILNWDYYKLSIHSVLDTFLSVGILFGNDQVKVEGQISSGTPQKAIDIAQTLTLLDKYVEFLSLLCLQNAEFLNLNRYYLACAIISVSRQRCNIADPWRDELVELTGL